MRRPDSWGELTRIERPFLILEERILSGTITSYAQIHPEAFHWHGWDMISGERLFKMLRPFLRQQLQRAQSAMPAIYQNLSQLDPSAIETQNDWYRVPVLFKDDFCQDLPTASIRQMGFREHAAQDPFSLRPADLPAASAVFGSGGSLGRYTPTFVTALDRQREIEGWRRGHDFHGLVPGDTALFTYNTTHKGGQWMQESLWQHGVNVLLRRPEEDAARVLENLRIYRANVLFTVQQPPEALQNQAKAVGVNLQSLILASLENPAFQGILIPDEKGRRQVDFIFLGGFAIVPQAVELAHTCLGDIPIATLLGSSEAIPQASSTNPALTPSGACHHNNLHLLHGPHYIEVVKPDGERWVPVSKGEEGLLVYTSFARDGTIWIRYAPGDVATRLLDEGECPCGITSPVISGVHRKDPLDQAGLFITGCAAG